MRAGYGPQVFAVLEVPPPAADLFGGFCYPQEDGLARIDAIFKMVKEQGASDLHISTGAAPMLRVSGEIRPVESPELTGEQTRQLLYEMMSAEQRSQFERDRDIDFAYEVPGEVRVRCNLFEQIRGNCRVVPAPSHPDLHPRPARPARVRAALRRAAQGARGRDRSARVRQEHDAGSAPRTTSTTPSTATSSPSRTRSSTCTRT